MTSTNCPECAGPWWPAHPAGVLTFQHQITCTILVAEDTTRAADRTRPDSRRPATPTEKALLGHLGWTDITADLQTHLQHVTRSVVRRDFPDATPPA